MASIVKKGKKHYVVYWALDKNMQSKQHWECVDSLEEAKLRKKEVEYQQEAKVYIAPTNHTANEWFDAYLDSGRWSPNTKQSYAKLLDNYVRPYLGKMQMRKITTQNIDQLYLHLQTVNSHKPGKNKTNVTPSTIYAIHKMLHASFAKAKKWKWISENPVEDAEPPEPNYRKREEWDVDELAQVLESSKDPRFILIGCLAFACTMRVGEVLGLTWDKVLVTPETIERNESMLTISRQVCRISKNALDDLRAGDPDLVVFPSKESAKTVLVLKKPKTKTSARNVYIPKRIAEMLLKWQESCDTMSPYRSPKYIDFNLVFPSETGNPLEEQYIGNTLRRLVRGTQWEGKVFHGIRHSSITCKLELTNGDIKAVQGDSGHAQAQLVTDVYAHIRDSNRKNTAVLMNDKIFEEPPENPGQDTDLKEAFQAFMKIPMFRQLLESANARSVESK